MHQTHAYGNPTEDYELIAVALRASCRMERILDDNPTGWKLPATAAAEYEESGFSYAEVAARISQRCELSGRKLFNVTIKHHMLCHLAISAKYLHPRLGWCYMNEDYMMWIRKPRSRRFEGSLHGSLKSSKHHSKFRTRRPHPRHRHPLVLAVV